MNKENACRKFLIDKYAKHIYAKFEHMQGKRSDCSQQHSTILLDLLG